MILVYVDDIVFIDTNFSLTLQFVTQLNGVFPLIDFGALSYFLGIVVKHMASSMFLNQHEYIYNLIDQTDFSKCKPIATPTLSQKYCLNMMALFLMINIPSNTGAS